MAEGNMPVLGAKERNCATSWFLKAFPMALLSEEWAKRNHSQSLDRLRTRGGLSVVEMLANVERRRFEKMDSFEAEQRLLAALADHLTPGPRVEEQP